LWSKKRNNIKHLFKRIRPKGGLKIVFSSSHLFNTINNITITKRIMQAICGKCTGNSNRSLSFANFLLAFIYAGHSGEAAGQGTTFFLPCKVPAKRRPEAYPADRMSAAGSLPWRAACRAGKRRAKKSRRTCRQENGVPVRRFARPPRAPAQTIPNGTFFKTEIGR